MAESASGQDEANPVFRLATRVSKMGVSSPLEISRKEKFSFGHIINPLFYYYFRNSFLNYSFLFIHPNFQHSKLSLLI